MDAVLQLGNALVEYKRAVVAFITYRAEWYQERGETATEPGERERFTKLAALLKEQAENLVALEGAEFETAATDWLRIVRGHTTG